MGCSRLPRCSFALVVAPLLPVVAPGCSAVPSFPGVAPVRSVAPAGAPLLPAVFPGRCSSFASVGRCSAASGCWSRLHHPLFQIRTTKKNDPQKTTHKKQKKKQEKNRKKTEKKQKKNRKKTEKKQKKTE